MAECVSLQGKEKTKEVSVAVEGQRLCDILCVTFPSQECLRHLTPLG